ncbi:hypothetical protein TTHERM_01054260 (macronuclear) [Tetrahymena thermophila SB210]|uniref:Uncharacterized protein n=1 Tax=Tetrahymena thermophila (strain SB210) TaxID=312017 RepID=Q22CC5_TETTS|nr:hypothetical protein TTHERM_01054260 [Tetrahymena thermophila SB210]EAR82941.3 hypothetical protein TTHERM_01054260 [Tetrahymena thermophila SB210]|eukprot:XP_001030604.3 hypothetical protein TTHERM_01054260 [Tetrahymena thermophila SB210]
MSQKKITTSKSKLNNEKQAEIAYNQDVAQNKIERKNNETLFHFLQRRTSFSLAKKVNESKRNASFHEGKGLNKSALISDSTINNADHLSTSKKKKIQFQDNNKDKEDNFWSSQHENRQNNHSIDLFPITPTKLKDFLKSPSNNVSVDVLQQSSSKKSILGNSVLLFKNHIQNNNQQKGILQDIVTNNNSIQIDDLFSSAKKENNHFGLAESFYEVNQCNKSSRYDLDNSKRRDQSEDNMKKSILKKQKKFNKNEYQENKENTTSNNLTENEKTMQNSIMNRSYVKEQINILKEKSNLDFSAFKQNFQSEVEFGEKKIKSQIQKLLNFVGQSLGQIEQLKMKVEESFEIFQSLDRHVLNNYQFFQEVPHFLEKYKSVKSSLGLLKNYAQNVEINQEEFDQRIQFFQNAYNSQVEQAIKETQTKALKQNKQEIENLERQIKEVVVKNEYLTQENKILKSSQAQLNKNIDFNSVKKNSSSIFIAEDLSQQDCDYHLKKENKKLHSKVEELLSEIYETSNINESIQQNLKNQIKRNEVEISELRSEKQQFIKDLQQIENDYSKKVNHLEQQLKKLQINQQGREDRNQSNNSKLSNENLMNQIRVLNETLEEKEKIRLKQKKDFEYASDIMTQEIVKLKKEIKQHMLEKESLQRKFSEFIGQAKQLEAYMNQNEQLLMLIKSKEDQIDDLFLIIKEIKSKSKEMGFDRYLKCYFKKANISDQNMHEKKPFKI